MPTLNDLVRTMEDRAGIAPDGAGLVEAAKAGAARIRRRRRITQASVAGGLAVVVAVGTPAALRLWAADEPVVPVVPAVPDTSRTPAEMTLEFDPSLEHTSTRWGTSGSGQVRHATFETGEEQDYTATVFAYPPGSRDQAIPRTPKESIEVGGQPAVYQNNSRSEQISWTDAEGRVISVSHHIFKGKAGNSADRERLESIAAAVRFGEPRKVAAPVRLGALPDGLTLAGISVDDVRMGYATVVLSFPDTKANDKRQVDILFMKGPDPDPGAATGVDPVGGFPAWYGGEGPRRKKLLVDTGECNVTFISSPGMTQQELHDLATAAELKACEDPGTWVPPLG